ncbi:MAG TPA: VOC family protein [Acidimicrobiales bacterium]|jgi:catechol 2,3-dioxygenase-like lactoylglutathione lyase family enzyme|nr:VOC family protein [Acidimicrobiales bacterium]
MSVVNHVGQVVTDIDRSKRFYVEVFGFEEWYELRLPDEAVVQLCSLTAPLRMSASYLTLGDFVLELIHYAAPGATASYQPRTMNDPGLTHLSISVDDIRATAERAAHYGGTIIEESDVGAAIFIRDPDGQLLELLPSSFGATRPARP